MQVQARGQSGAHCHKHIAKVAKELCRASYGELMSHDLLYKHWKMKHPGLASNPKKLEQQFVNQKWGMWIDAARTTLTLLLREPIDEKQKEEIMEILVLDSSLIKGRQNPARVTGQLAQKQ